MKCCSDGIDEGWFDAINVGLNVGQTLGRIDGVGDKMMDGMELVTIVGLSEIIHFKEFNFLCINII